MNQHNEQIKAEIVKQIQETNNPIVKRVLEKRLKEIDKTVTK
jgi:hypothetical protein